MSFATLSGAWVLAGLAGLAAALFALQQLRTRYRDVTVVTTLFWKQVVDEAPVRKFRERFRHPLAYALILAICALIWLAFADPHLARADDETFHVLVLDGSAGMAAGGRFAAAVGQMERYVSRVPADRRQVIWSGGELRPLLAPGEHELLLRKRLERMAPEAAPASVERLLRQLSAAPRGRKQTSVVVFGDAPVRQRVIDLLPATVTVARAAEAGRLQGNAGITSLGVTEAASGAWDRVDVLVTLQGTEDRAGAGVGDAQMTLDDRPISAQSIARTPAADGLTFAVRDLPAAGGVFTVRLTATDALSLDDRASLRLPSKPILKVQLSPSLDRALGPVLRADAGVTLVTTAPDVVVRRSGETVGGAAPALEFVRADAQTQAFLLTHPDSLESDAVFADAVRDIGLTQIDAMSLAREAGRPIEVSIAAGRQWRFSVWEDLLSEHYNFTRSRAFPLFVANSLRWLAGTPAWYPVVAAGAPLTAASAGDAARVIDARGRAIDPLGAAFVPPSAGDLRLAGAGAGRTLSVSLLDPDVTRGRRDTAMAIAALNPMDVGSGAGAATWLGVLALALLAFEWYLFQRGRLP
jgi:hypothetical protein